MTEGGIQTGKIYYDVLNEQPLSYLTRGIRAIDVLLRLRNKKKIFDHLS